MIIQGSHDVNTPDKIFVAMYNNGSAVSRGEWVSFDYMDYSATALGDLIGQMVTLLSASRSTTALPVWDVVGCAEETMAAGVSGTLGRLYLVQVYGFHDSCLYDNDGLTIGTGTLRPDPVVNGGMIAEDMTDTPEPEKAAARSGIPLVDSQGYLPAIIKCM